MRQVNFRYDGQRWEAFPLVKEITVRSAANHERTVGVRADGTLVVAAAVEWPASPDYVPGLVAAARAAVERARGLVGRAGLEDAVDEITV